MRAMPPTPQRIRLALRHSAKGSSIRPAMGSKRNLSPIPNDRSLRPICTSSSPGSSKNYPLRTQPHMLTQHRFGGQLALTDAGYATHTPTDTAGVKTLGKRIEHTAGHGLEKKFESHPQRQIVEADMHFIQPRLE